ncbi:hypothetical protein Acr_00g0075360 [Actinidia rufa]|uniref:Uncharacterized protein n=1 Tax=Actinidia rufa TaxID=165716 RepID=A0A7J0DT10_9ERIC|nr:hypothetical protein Acr_00g0075360 [Actinidia rufa]
MNRLETKRKRIAGERECRGFEWERRRTSLGVSRRSIGRSHVCGPGWWCRLGQASVVHGDEREVVDRGEPVMGDTPESE